MTPSRSRVAIFSGLVSAYEKARYNAPLVVSQSNHTSGREVPLMSFDSAQDERDSKYDVFTQIYENKHWSAQNCSSR